MEIFYFSHNKSHCKGMYFIASVHPETQKSTATCPVQKLLLKNPTQPNPFNILKQMPWFLGSWLPSESSRLPVLILPNNKYKTRAHNKGGWTAKASVSPPLILPSPYFKKPPQAAEIWPLPWQGATAGSLRPAWAQAYPALPTAAPFHQHAQLNIDKMCDENCAQMPWAQN